MKEYNQLIQQKNMPMEQAKILYVRNKKINSLVQ